MIKSPLKLKEFRISDLDFNEDFDLVTTSDPYNWKGKPTVIEEIWRQPLLWNTEYAFEYMKLAFGYPDYDTFVSEQPYINRYEKRELIRLPKMILMSRAFPGLFPAIFDEEITDGMKAKHIDSVLASVSGMDYGFGGFHLCSWLPATGFDFVTDTSEELNTFFPTYEKDKWQGHECLIFEIVGNVGAFNFPYLSYLETDSPPLITVNGYTARAECLVDHLDIFDRVRMHIIYTLFEFGTDPHWPTRRAQSIATFNTVAALPGDRVTSEVLDNAIVNDPRITTSIRNIIKEFYDL